MAKRKVPSIWLRKMGGLLCRHCRKLYWNEQSIVEHERFHTAQLLVAEAFRKSFGFRYDTGKKTIIDCPLCSPEPCIGGAHRNALIEDGVIKA